MCPSSIPPKDSGSILNHALVPGSSGANEASPYTVEQIDSEIEVSRLQAEWNRLSEDAESPNVFMTYDWFRIWNDQSARDPRSQRSPNILALRKDEAVVGISPLIRRVSTRLGARKLEFVTNNADYNDFVLGDDPTGQIEAIVRFLARTSDQWDLVDLRDLRTNPVMIARIESALSCAKLPYRILPEKGRCPYLPIETNASTIINKLPGNVRRTLRRRTKQAAAEGLRMRIIENPAHEPGLLEKLVLLDYKKHQQKILPALIGMNAKAFQSLFDSLGPRGWLYIALLEKGEQPVAFQLGFRSGRKLWAYSTAYDPLFSRFAPGTLLVPAMLDYGFSHGYVECDFLRGEEPYKWVWTNRYHRNSQLLIWNRRWRSRAIAFLYHDFRIAIHRLLGRRA